MRIETKFSIFGFSVLLVVCSAVLSGFPATARGGNEDAKKEYERLLKREEELIGYEPQSIHTVRGGMKGLDNFERAEIDRQAGVRNPLPRMPRDHSDIEEWSNYTRDMELQRIRERKDEIRAEAFSGEGSGKTPSPKPTPNPKPTYGPPAPGEPEPSPQKAKPRSQPGVGPYGPEPLPAEDPNQPLANAAKPGQSGDPKDVVSVNSTTNPKTGIRVEVVKLQDGTTAVTQFDKDGAVIGQTTHGPKGGLSKRDVSKIIYAHHSRQWGGGSVPNKYKWRGPGGGGGQGGGVQGAGGGGPVGGAPGGGDGPTGEEGGPMGDDGNGEPPMEVGEPVPLPPGPDDAWSSLPEVDFSDPNNPYSLGGVNEPVSQGVDIMEVTKQDPAVGHVAFDSGRGEAVVVMKDGTTMTTDAYLKSKEDTAPKQGGGPMVPGGSPDTAKINVGPDVAIEPVFRGHELQDVRGEADAPHFISVMNTSAEAHTVFLTFLDKTQSQLSTTDLKRRSKRIGKALDGFLKEGIKNPFQSSGRLEFEGALGRQFRSGPGSQANLGDLLQGNNFGSAGSSSGSSSSSSCN